MKKSAGAGRYFCMFVFGYNKKDGVESPQATVPAVYLH
jgi:hypothetical protein